ncbi:MAG TPA: aminotransferase [Pseudomonadales bacterium]
MSKLARMDVAQLEDELARLEADLTLTRGNRIKLDLTRGKPAADQLDLSAPMDDVLQGNYLAADGTDSRNYGGLRGLPEARALGGELLDADPARVICWGNSSLTLMHLVADTALRFGLWNDERRWNRAEPPKMLAPVPGYDRHFTLSESLGIGLVTVPLTDDGPDMDRVEALTRDDPDVKGIWCVPKYSNPTGCIYSDEVVGRIARLPAIAAADDFVVFWDNAYAVHDLEFPPPKLASILPLADAAGTADHVVVFGSTSKITYAGAGLGFLAASETVLRVLESRMATFSIGPDKVNQLRHARFLEGRLTEHMKRHAKLLRPKFAAVEKALREGLGDWQVATWTTPRGGYFVSLDTRPGLASRVAQLAAEAGLNLTPPGATFPYGRDPDDRNLRIAPTFASVDDVKVAMEILVLCVKLASVEDELRKRKEKR